MLTRALLIVTALLVSAAPADANRRVDRVMPVAAKGVKLGPCKGKALVIVVRDIDALYDRELVKRGIPLADMRMALDGFAMPEHCHAYVRAGQALTDLCVTVRHELKHLGGAKHTHDGGDMDRDDAWHQPCGDAFDLYTRTVG